MLRRAAKGRNKHQIFQLVNLLTCLLSNFPAALSDGEVATDPIFASNLENKCHQLLWKKKYDVNEHSSYSLDGK